MSFSRSRARGGGIANAELARQAAVVQQQVADGGADIEADGAEVAELGVDGLQATFGNEDRPLWISPCSSASCMGKETVLQRRHRQLKLGVVAQGGDIGLQLRRW